VCVHVCVCLLYRFHCFWFCFKKTYNKYKSPIKYYKNNKRI